MCGGAIIADFIPQNSSRFISSNDHCPDSPFVNKFNSESSHLINKKASLSDLGTFNTAEEAAMAYDKETRKIRGKKAKINFPNEDDDDFVVEKKTQKFNNRNPPPPPYYTKNNNYNKQLEREDLVQNLDFGFATSINLNENSGFNGTNIPTNSNVMVMNEEIPFSGSEGGGGGGDSSSSLGLWSSDSFVNQVTVKQEEEMHEQVNNIES